MLNILYNNMKLRIRKPNDFHHHLRDGEILKQTVSHCFSKFKNVVVMPNLKPPIISIQQAMEYKERIKAVDKYDGNPMMTLYLHKNISLQDLRQFKNYPNMIGIKYYPKNATTNSESGVENIQTLYPILKVMEQEDIPLLIHGELNLKHIDVFKKEKRYIEDELPDIISTFPRLRIVLEHISTKAAVEFVLTHKNVYATITPQHLLLDRNAIFDGGIHPHLYCLPILKKKRDQEALVSAAISGNSKFFLGTDNAPHIESTKLTSCGCAGIFNSPVAIEIITSIFEKENQLDKLEKFISTNGCDFYKLPYNQEYIVLEKKYWKVPERYGELIPLCAGKQLEWCIL